MNLPFLISHYEFITILAEIGVGNFGRKISIRKQKLIGMTQNGFAQRTAISLFVSITVKLKKF